MNQVVTDPVNSPSLVLIYLGLVVEAESCVVDTRYSASILFWSAKNPIQLSNVAVVTFLRQ